MNDIFLIHEVAKVVQLITIAFRIVHRLDRNVICNGNKVGVYILGSIVHCNSRRHLMDGLDYWFHTFLWKLCQICGKVSTSWIFQARNWFALTLSLKINYSKIWKFLQSHINKQFCHLMQNLLIEFNNCIVFLSML